MFPVRSTVTLPKNKRSLPCHRLSRVDPFERSGTRVATNPPAKGSHPLYLTWGCRGVVRPRPCRQPSSGAHLRERALYPRWWSLSDADRSSAGSASRFKERRHPLFYSQCLPCIEITIVRITAHARRHTPGPAIPADMLPASGQ